MHSYDWLEPKALFWGLQAPSIYNLTPLDCNFKGLKQGRSPLDLLGPKALCCGLQGLKTEVGAKPPRYFRAEGPIIFWPPAPSIHNISRKREGSMRGRSSPGVWNSISFFLEPTPYVGYLTLFHTASQIVLIHTARGPWDPPYWSQLQLIVAPPFFFCYQSLMFNGGLQGFICLSQAVWSP